MNQEGFTVNEVKDPSTGPLFEVRIRHYIKTAWQTFLQYPAGFAGFILVIALVNVILLLIFYRIPVPLLWYLLAALMSPLFAGIYVVSARLLQRQSCDFTDFFAGFHYFLPLLIFGFISGLIWDGGFLLRHYLLGDHLWLRVIGHLAGLAFSLFFLFTPLLVVDRRLGLWEAMGLSRRTVQRRWGQFIGFIILVGLLIIPLGLVVSLVVILVSGAFKLHFFGFRTIMVICVKLMATLHFIADTTAYADLFGLQSKEY